MDFLWISDLFIIFVVCCGHGNKMNTLKFLIIRVVLIMLFCWMSRSLKKRFASVQPGWWPNWCKSGYATNRKMQILSMYWKVYIYSIVCSHHIMTLVSLQDLDDTCWYRYRRCHPKSIHPGIEIERWMDFLPGLSCVFLMLLQWLEMLCQTQQFRTHEKEHPGLDLLSDVPRSGQNPVKRWLIASLSSTDLQPRDV